ncbi:ROK family protein [Paenibacillus eucommiae]|uniref:Glucokinase n=1 Tax=Paenibacillus eucommiae TaxID=1355755 RepID=A0ABS4J248_9BACL|nr:ROK family protein [Paenibacillus eucommiae]MBP1993870.1 glucokinase [Paenibacillus eucommiae]
MLAIGIDIGGTKISGGIVNETGEIIFSKERSTDASRGRDYVLAGLDGLISELVAWQVKVDVIGIGSAGRINVQEGSVYFATPNLPNWTGLQLKQYIEAKHQIPAVIDNDVNTAGIGEKWLGAGKEYASVVCLTLGTGVAAAVFVDGKLIHGHHWSTGEIGHFILYPHGKPCNCGQRGCLEQYCSGTALFRSYNELRGEAAISSGKEFFQLLQAGDSVAEQVLDTFIDDLAVAMVSLANIYDPEAFIVGGGLIETKSLWWDEVLKRFERYANPAVSRTIIIPAAYKNQAGLLGAAKLGFDYLQLGTV